MINTFFRYAHRLCYLSNLDSIVVHLVNFFDVIGGDCSCWPSRTFIISWTGTSMFKIFPFFHGDKWWDRVPLNSVQLGFNLRKHCLSNATITARYSIFQFFPFLQKHWHRLTQMTVKQLSVQNGYNFHRYFSKYVRS